MTIANNFWCWNFRAKYCQFTNGNARGDFQPIKSSANVQIGQKFQTECDWIQMVFALFTVKAENERERNQAKKELGFCALCIVKIHNKAPFVDIMNSVFNALIGWFKRWFYFLFSKILNSICIGCGFFLSRATFPLKIHTRDLYEREHNVFAIEPCVRWAALCCVRIFTGMKKQSVRELHNSNPTK